VLIQENQLLLRWADHIAYIRRPAYDFRSPKESDFQSDYYGILERYNSAKICETLYSTLRCDTVIWRTWVIQQLYLKLRPNRCS